MLINLKFLMLVVWLAVVMCSPPANAGTVAVVRPLSFGNLLVNWNGATIIVNATEGNVAPSAKVPGSATITNGHPATLELSDFGDADLTISYPTSVVLSGPNGHELTLSKIFENSEIDPKDDGLLDDLRVGGELSIPARYESGSYTGSLVVTITTQ